MHATRIQKLYALAICVLLITSPLGGESEATPGGAADTAPLSADQLRALAAPIALYPDPLVARILAAATFPDQVAMASYWIEQHKDASRQYWDTSVKALTPFPSVLNNMAKNLAWTSSLGQAYHSQPSEVVNAILALRAQARAHGTLKSGPQITITQPTPDVIQIEPANPQAIYVPEYDPATVYGVPYTIPYYTAAGIAAGASLTFGPAIAIGALGGWSMDWVAGAAVYNHNRDLGNPAWHGGFYNGDYRAGYGYQNSYERPAAPAERGSANRAAETRDRAMPEKRENLPHSWAQADDGRSANVFGGVADRFGGGWQARAESFRGWGSMRMSGFSGGRFAGDHFGGGQFFPAIAPK